MANVKKCIWNSKYEYINIILGKIYLINYTSFIIVINIIGLYLFLHLLAFGMLKVTLPFNSFPPTESAFEMRKGVKNLSFEVNIKWSIKYTPL